MSNYTITTNFGAKDDLPSGNAAKVIKGSEFTTEFTNIKTAVNSKADLVSPTFTGNTALNGTTTFGPDGTSTFNGTVNFTKDVTFDTNTMFVDVSENRVGIGTTSPTRDLSVNGTVGVGNGTVETLVSFSDRGIIGTQSNHDLEIRTNGTERMRIDSSGNVGIGTSSPAYPLDIAGASGTTLSVRNTSTVSSILLSNGSSANQIFSRGANSSTGRDLAFVQGTSEAMRIDSSGNVGIGTTNPDSMLHVRKNQTADTAVEVSNLGTAGASTSSSFIVSESEGVPKGWFRRYRDGTSRTAVGFTENLVFEGGINSSPTERMRIDASGNVGIGTSNPANTLTVGNLEASSIYADATVGIKCDTNHKGLILQENSGAEQWSMGVNANGDLNFYDSAVTDPLVTFQDNSGNVGIGTASPSGKLDVELGADGVIAEFRGTDSDIFQIKGQSNTIALDTRNTAALAFEMQGQERMRIDSSGNLLVGTTDQYALNGGFTVQAGTVDYISVGHASSVASGNYYAAFRHGTNTIGTITQNGTTGVLYNTSSDERLKENIADSADAGSKIDAIQIRQFDWKSDSSHQDYGVIAQELVTVAPEAVHQPEDSEEMMGVDYSKLVPMLIKEVQTLRNRVAQLENN